MLVLTRHVHQSIVIGHDVVVTVLEVRGDQVRLGITAPRDVQVHREEVFVALATANREAAASAQEIEILNFLNPAGKEAAPPRTPAPGPAGRPMGRRGAPGRSTGRPPEGTAGPGAEKSATPQPALVGEDQRRGTTTATEPRPEKPSAEKLRRHGRREGEPDRARDMSREGGASGGENGNEGPAGSGSKPSSRLQAGGTARAPSSRTVARPGRAEPGEQISGPRAIDVDLSDEEVHLGAHSPHVEGGAAPERSAVHRPL